MAFNPMNKKYYRDDTLYFSNFDFSDEDRDYKEFLREEFEENKAQDEYFENEG